MENLVACFSIFLEGLASFMSPCILPLIPLYMGYLTGNAKTVNEDGTIRYKRSKVLLTTICFVLGICTVFVLAALSLTPLKTTLAQYELHLTLLGGLLLVVMGCVQLGWITIPVLQREFKFKSSGQDLNYLKAFVMGFAFSFAWTPCVGPFLTSALVQATTASTSFWGICYLACYCVGFSFIFILLGLFTEQMLNLLKKHQKLLMSFVKIGAGIILIWGLFMVATSFSMTSGINQPAGSAQSGQNSSSANNDGTTETLSEIETYDFTLVDQNGEEHTLSDYKGKTVMLTFWATWCGYCKQELPVLDALNQTRDDVVVLTLVYPGSAGELDKAGIQAFIKEKGYQLPVLFDETGDVFREYGINSYPMTYVYRLDGSMMGYLPGAADEDTLVQIIENSKTESK